MSTLLATLTAMLLASPPAPTNAAAKPGRYVLHNPDQPAIMVLLDSASGRLWRLVSLGTNGPVALEPIPVLTGSVSLGKTGIHRNLLSAGAPADAGGAAYPYTKASYLQRVRSVYPEYQTWDDGELFRALIKKFPEELELIDPRSFGASFTEWPVTAAPVP